MSKVKFERKFTRPEEESTTHKVIFKYFVVEKIRNERLDLCQSCDKYNKLKFCSECGCFMPAKISLYQTKCPLNKWGEVYNEEYLSEE